MKGGLLRVLAAGHSPAYADYLARGTRDEPSLEENCDRPMDTNEAGGKKGSPEEFAACHASLTRRHFVQLGTAGLAALGASDLWARQISDRVLSSPALAAATSQLEYLTPASKFTVQRRGKPVLSELPPETLPSLGLTRETWKLEVMADPHSDSELGNPLTKAGGNALDWPGLMKLAEKHPARFLHVLTCTNSPKPYGMGLWDGVPLREILWLTQPKQNIRRVFFDGCHHDDPQQVFQASLPIGRVLEEAPGELLVIACYKLNGQWLSQPNGGPVRMIVPGAYGNRSIKWLQRVFLTNIYQANDTYAQGNNDVESPIKTCAVHPHAAQRQDGRAVCHDRPGAGWDFRPEEGSVLAEACREAPAGKRSVPGHGGLAGCDHPAATERVGQRSS